MKIILRLYKKNSKRYNKKDTQSNLILLRFQQKEY